MDSILFMSYVDVLWSRNWMINHWSSWVVANKECWRAKLSFEARQKEKETTSKSWCKKFDVLTPLKSEEEIKEVSNITNVQEIVDISVGGEAKGVRPICKNDVVRPLSLRTKKWRLPLGVPFVFRVVPDWSSVDTTQGVIWSSWMRISETCWRCRFRWLTKEWLLCTISRAEAKGSRRTEGEECLCCRYWRRCVDKLQVLKSLTRRIRKTSRWVLTDDRHEQQCKSSSS